LVYTTSGIKIPFEDQRPTYRAREEVKKLKVASAGNFWEKKAKNTEVITSHLPQSQKKSLLLINSEIFSLRLTGLPLNPS
jgi:hypothetical protein